MNKQIHELARCALKYFEWFCTLCHYTKLKQSKLLNSPHKPTAADNISIDRMVSSRGMVLMLSVPKIQDPTW